MSIGDAQQLLETMSQYNTLTGIAPSPAKSLRRNDADCAGSIEAPDPPRSPIDAEVAELQIVTDNLERAIFQLADRLHSVRQFNEKVKGATPDSRCSEPSTGCSLKDSLAEHKQHILYLERAIHAVKDSLYV